MPIRLRLTLAFALAMAVVLTATGLLVYTRIASDLRQTIDGGLEAHAAAVAALIRPADKGVVDRLGRTADPDQGFVQVFNQHGRVIDETAELDLDRKPLLTAGQLARARSGPIFLPGRLGDDPTRLLALPIRTEDGSDLVVVVGASLENVQNTLARLQHELLIGGPLALLLASLAGYALAASALRPVERMRRRAAVISSGEPGQRLPVAGQRDEITRLGETLNEMLGRLDLGLERERQFVADASHELRTPLALLKTEIELALDEPISADELRQALHSAGEETDRLVQLADDLLLLASVDKGLLPVRREPVELDGLFAVVALRFERRAAEPGRRITPERTSLVVFADRLRLEQALGNLVENALRHGAGTIRLFPRAQAGSVELHVADEGDGFPPDFLGRAFERFSRADEARGRGGTGLGLAIVAAVARAHGGDAGAANLQQGGGDVWLALPAASSEPENAESSESSESSESRVAATVASR